jgi:hypothetical protein
MKLVNQLNTFFDQLWTPPKMSKRFWMVIGLFVMGTLIAVLLTSVDGRNGAEAVRAYLDKFLACCFGAAVMDIFHQEKYRRKE